MEVRNRFKGLDLTDRVPDELWTEIQDIVQETGSKNIPIEKKCKKAKWLSQEAGQMVWYSCLFKSYYGQESLRRNGVVLIVNKRVRNAVLGYNLKNDRMISAHFQGKPFNVTLIQVYAPTSNAEEAEVEQFYENLQDLLELTPQKRCPFHYRMQK